MTSSVMPSAKNSFSGSALRLRNGSTATDATRGRSPDTTEPTAGVATPSVSSPANAPTEGNRSAGTLASARTIARATAGGTVSRSRRTDGTGSTSRFERIEYGVAPAYGTSPASISNSTQARLYWSLRASAPSSSACSGLMYSGVPTTSPVPVMRDDAAALTARAMPKSATMASP